MNKISVSNIVKYLRKSPKSRTAFIANLKKPKVKKESDDETGGNYWVHSYSTVSRVFRTEELNSIDFKIDKVAEKKVKAQLERSKIMYQKNIEILFGAKDFEFKNLKPFFDVSYLKNSKSTLDISSVPIEISPNHVYHFEEDNRKQVGAIWFVIIKGGYDHFELALFNYCLYQYLYTIYKDKYTVSEKYCFVLDITNGRRINYAEVLSSNRLHKIKEELDLLGKAI